ncbi:MAG: pyrroline-5-carboxylate reductase [Clostridia bacterium]
MKFELGIIGAGVMANALLTQILNKEVLPCNKLTIYDINKSKCFDINKEINVSDNIQSLIDNSNMVLFAVKPQNYLDICKANTFRDDMTVLSIMAGVKIGTIRQNINNYKCGVLRIMPNMPCKIGKGICALCFDKVDTTKKEILCNIFKASGDIIQLEESKFDAVTSISGSGPAYVYMFLQGMINGGQNGGLSYEESKKLAIATLIGASEICKTTSEELDTMINKVCSKGGTTIEAVNVYKDSDLVGIITKGVDACRQRSEELSKLL